MGVVGTSTSQGRNICIRSPFGAFYTSSERYNQRLHIVFISNDVFGHFRALKISFMASKNPWKFRTRETIEKNSKVETHVLSQWNRWVDTDFRLDQHGCAKIDILFSFYVMFLSQGLGFLGFLQTRIFPMLYLSDIHAGSNSSTRPNISENQLRRLKCTLSCTTQLPRY
jgi:hypothetical protein